MSLQLLTDETQRAHQRIQVVGVEKRRHLLAYLQRHFEELCPRRP